MKKIFIKILPLLAMSVSLFGCNSKHDVTITIDAGLGYFMPNIYDPDSPRSTSITFTVKSGRSFNNLPFSQPILVEGAGVETDEEFPIFPQYYTNQKNQKISPNSIINDDATFTAHYFADFASAKSIAYGSHIRGLIGALKRAILNNKPTNHLMTFSAMFDDYYNRLEIIYPCFAMGKTGAALSDAYGETGDERFVPLYETMYRQIYNVNNQVAYVAGSGYQGIIGAVKRIILDDKSYNQKWWEQFVVDTTNAMKIVGPNKAMYFSKCIAALADQIGETEYEGRNIQKSVNNFIFDAFKFAHNAEQACSIYNATDIFVGDYKRGIVNNLSDTELLTLFNSYKLQVIAILNS